MRFSTALTLLVMSSLSQADGQLFKDGRYPDKHVTVLQLTNEQKQLISLYWKCRNNQFSPYIFTLTPSQSEVLRKESGTTASRFAIFQSIAGDTGVDLDVNVINRFSEDRFEVPHERLISEGEREHWDKEIIGWQPNPFENLSASQLENGSCPAGLDAHNDR